MSGTPRVRDQAIHYLTTRSNDLQTVCDFADFNIDQVMKAAKKLEQLGIHEGVVYLRKLMKIDEVDDDYSTDN
jgi:hypothetical protein